MRSWLALLGALALLALAHPASADHSTIINPERRDTGWALYLDDDILVGRDRGYTGGAVMTLSGQRAQDYWWSLDPLLGWVDQGLGLNGLGSDQPSRSRHSISVGLAGFTPRDTDQKKPIRDDRPYAGLVFLSNTHQRIFPVDRVVYQSSLMLGALGTDIVPDIQNGIHSAIGDPRAQGWDHQIADGGEPTADYMMVRYQTFAWHQAPGFGDYQVQTAIGGSVGFATQVGVGLNARWGRFGHAWWAFVPDYAQYVALGTPITGRSGQSGASDLYVWGGVNLRYSAYNALLQGQFRDSDVTYDRGDLRSGIAEASLGLTMGLTTSTNLTFALRARTPELPDVEADPPVWGSLVLTASY